MAYNLRKNFYEYLFLFDIKNYDTKKKVITNLVKNIKEQIPVDVTYEFRDWANRIFLKIEEKEEISDNYISRLKINAISICKGGLDCVNYFFHNLNESIIMKEKPKYHSKIHKCK